MTALADSIVVLHAAFVVFVAAGGLAVVRWPRLAWLHLPAAAWGAAIELTDWACPLTPLEKWLRRRAGGDAYEGGFIDHYLVPLVYPAGLTREHQIGLGIAVIAVNLAAYTWAWRRRMRARPGGREAARG